MENSRKMMIVTNICLFIGVVIATIVYCKTGETRYFPHIVTVSIVVGGFLGFGVKRHLDNKDAKIKAETKTEEVRPGFKKKKKKKKRKKR